MKEVFIENAIKDSVEKLVSANIENAIEEKVKEFREELEYQIKELKKQLTTNQILHRDCKVDNLKNISKIEEMENQQKEFINYLEDNWKQTQDIWYIKILQKYKSIIGDDK